MHIDGNAESIRHEGIEFFGMMFALDKGPLLGRVVRPGQGLGTSQRALVARVKMRSRREYLTLAYLHKVVALVVWSHGECMVGFCMHFRYC